MANGANADAEFESDSQLETLLENVDIEYMLEFETQIFLDIVQQDGLVVAAKGLNLELVILNILKVYCDPGNLVLVLNTNEAEEKFFMEHIKEHVYRTSYTTNVVERQDVYLSGGIQFVSTRILVVDMLKKRLPIEKITGIVIFRAHKIVESCQEAFILRLYRQHNKTGFIKAFSNSAQSFTYGFGHVERIMRSLFVKELLIWPRFHTLVIKSLKEFEPKVIELHIPVSECMGKIQTNLLELINLTVQELKRFNKTFELQEITVENCLIKKFHKVLQLQLDAIWHQLSVKSRQLISDLKTLRHLLLELFYADPISFYALLQTYRTKEYAMTATWVLNEPAELLFNQAKQLVYVGNRELNPSFCPKWNPLFEILKVEIPNEIKKIKNKTEYKIMILCSDNKTCHQLKTILSNGPHQYLLYLALNKGVKFTTLSKEFKNCEQTLDSKTGAVKKSASTSKSKEEKEEEVEDFKSSYLLTMSQTFDETKTKADLNETSDYVFEPFEELEDMNITQLCEAATAPTILIQTFKGLEGSVNLQRTLEEVKPNFIIMYQSNITSIREIEMYEAHLKPEQQLKVYFLIHGETVEEQSYLTTMRREKDAFEFLIQTKATMVVPEDQDGKSDICANLQRDAKSAIKNTRHGGAQDETQAAQVRKLVIVDMREFRSELPALIHKRGVDIEPVTITVGDYILTDEICVERKSLSDLVGSLNSGRLYQQCTQMSRYYAKPMLLIEFDQNKPFNWQNNYMVSLDSNNFHVQQKLILLTMHFPKLKIIWSPSPYASAQLFEELKDGKPEPNIEYAAGIAKEEDLDLVETKYNTNIYDFVQKLPGINSKNIDHFLRNSTDLKSTLEKSEQELKELLGNEKDAKAFYLTLHGDHNPKEESKSKEKSKFKGSKFRFCKK